MRMKTEPEGEQYGEVNKREKSNGGNGMQTRGFNCRWTQRSGVGMGEEEGVYIYEYIYVCVDAHMQSQNPGTTTTAAPMLMRARGSIQTAERRALWKHRLCSCSAQLLASLSTQETRERELRLSHVNTQVPQEETWEDLAPVWSIRSIHIKAGRLEGRLSDQHEVWAASLPGLTWITLITQWIRMLNIYI